MTDSSVISRLIYLAAEHKPPIPRVVLKLLPHSDVIASVAANGLRGAGADMDIPLDQLKTLYQQGSKPDRGSSQEFQLLAGKLATEELEIRRDEMPFGEYLSRIKDVAEYVQSRGALIGYDEVGLDEESTLYELAKWTSGFEPLDTVLGGLYSGIFTFIAKPGHGKTSHMMTLMGELRRSEAVSSIWYFEQEIPLNLMMYRSRPMRQRIKFRSTDRFICGGVTMADLVRRVQDNPDPNRVIIIDSPDVMAGGEGEGKRFALESIYRGLIPLKDLTKAIFVTSWPRRKDTVMTMESVAEAWAKAWYSDAIIGITKLGRAPGSFTNVKYNVAKNRFGPPDGEVIFHYDYIGLGYETVVGKNTTGEEDW